jgi:ribosomal protein L21E
MQRFSEGDRVRVGIPDETDPDHERYHGVRGTVVATLEDDAGRATGDERDSLLFRVELENGHVEDFRWRDLRPR